MSGAGGAYGGGGRGNHPPSRLRNALWRQLTRKALIEHDHLTGSAILIVYPLNWEMTCSKRLTMFQTLQGEGYLPAFPNFYSFTGMPGWLCPRVIPNIRGIKPQIGKCRCLAFWRNQRER